MKNKEDLLRTFTRSLSEEQKQHYRRFYKELANDTAQEILDDTNKKQSRFGYLLGMTILSGWIVVALFFISIKGCDAIRAYHREQILLSCLQEAKNKTAASLCSFHWEPKEDK